MAVALAVIRGTNERQNLSDLVNSKFTIPTVYKNGVLKLLAPQAKLTPAIKRFIHPERASYPKPKEITGYFSHNHYIASMMNHLNSVYILY